MPLRASSHPGSPNSPSCSALAWYSCWPGLSPRGESSKRTRVARTAALTRYRYATQPTLPISIRLTSLALWQSDDCPSASKATLMNMDKYFVWIHYERLHNHNKAKHNKTVCIFLGIYCSPLRYISISKPGSVVFERVHSRIDAYHFGFI